MTHQYTKSFKICATCNYWGGDREVNTFGQHVNIVSPTQKGKCLLQGCTWKGVQKEAGFGCNKWERWGALK